MRLINVGKAVSINYCENEAVIEMSLVDSVRNFDVERNGLLRTDRRGEGGAYLVADHAGAVHQYLHRTGISAVRRITGYATGCTANWREMTAANTIIAAAPVMVDIK